MPDNGRVYLLMEGSYDPYVVGAYATRSLAEAAGEQRPKKGPLPTIDHWIEEYEIVGSLSDDDKEPPPPTRLSGGGGG